MSAYLKLYAIKPKQIPEAPLGSFQEYVQAFSQKTQSQKVRTQLSQVSIPDDYEGPFEDVDNHQPATQEAIDKPFSDRESFFEFYSYDNVVNQFVFPRNVKGYIERLKALKIETKIIKDKQTGTKKAVITHKTDEQDEMYKIVNEFEEELFGEKNNVFHRNNSDQTEVEKVVGRIFRGVIPVVVRGTRPNAIFPMHTGPNRPRKKGTLYSTAVSDAIGVNVRKDAYPSYWMYYVGMRYIGSLDRETLRNKASNYVSNYKKSKVGIDMKLLNMNIALVKLDIDESPAATYLADIQSNPIPFLLINTIEETLSMMLAYENSKIGHQQEFKKVLQVVEDMRSFYTYLSQIEKFLEQIQSTSVSYEDNKYLWTRYIIDTATEIANSVLTFPIFEDVENQQKALFKKSLLVPIEKQSAMLEFYTGYNRVTAQKLASENYYAMCADVYKLSREFINLNDISERMGGETQTTKEFLSDMRTFLSEMLSPFKIDGTEIPEGTKTLPWRQLQELIGYNTDKKRVVEVDANLRKKVLAKQDNLSDITGELRCRILELLDNLMDLGDEACRTNLKEAKPVVENLESMSKMLINRQYFDLTKISTRVIDYDKQLNEMIEFNEELYGEIEVEAIQSKNRKLADNETLDKIVDLDEECPEIKYITRQLETLHTRAEKRLQTPSLSFRDARDTEIDVAKTNRLLDLLSALLTRIANESRLETHKIITTAEDLLEGRINEAIFNSTSESKTKQLEKLLEEAQVSSIQSDDASIVSVLPDEKGKIASVDEYISFVNKRVSLLSRSSGKTQGIKERLEVILD